METEEPVAVALTARQEIERKIEAIKAKAAADVAELESHLASPGTWLDLELHKMEEYAKELVAKVRAAL